MDDDALCELLRDAYAGSAQTMVEAEILLRELRARPSDEQDAARVRRICAAALRHKLDVEAAWLTHREQIGPARRLWLWIRTGGRGRA
jgi:hypothetical protein